VSLEDLAAALRKEAEEECRALMEEARRQSLAVHSRSAEEREVLVERETRELARTLEAEGMTLVYQSSLAVDGERERIGAEFLRRVRAGSLERLDSLRETEGYPALFRSLAARAVAGMKGGVTLHLDPRDLDLVRGLPPRDPAPAVVPSLATRGGVLAESSDGRIRVDATLEACLDRFLRDTAPELLGMLEEKG
jgi:vacuolar-type H+-ATPase subunit E/Vma4